MKESKPIPAIAVSLATSLVQSPPHKKSVCEQKQKVRSRRKGQGSVLGSIPKAPVWNQENKVKYHIMPQLDKFTYFTQFFWSCLFLFTLSISVCYFPLRLEIRIFFFILTHPKVQRFISLGKGFLLICRLVNLANVNLDVGLILFMEQPNPAGGGVLPERPNSPSLSFEQWLYGDSPGKSEANPAFSPSPP
jgi:hypothetical protein